RVPAARSRRRCCPGHGRGRPARDPQRRPPRGHRAHPGAARHRDRPASARDRRPPLAARRPAGTRRLDERRSQGGRIRPFRLVCRAAQCRRRALSQSLSKEGRIMKITGVELRRIAMPLVAPFRTSFGTESARDILLLRAVLDGPSGESEGWGECVAMADPLYSSEYVDGTVDVLKRFFLPKLFAAADVDGSLVGPLLEPFKGHWMSKAA